MNRLILRTLWSTPSVAGRRMCSKAPQTPTSGAQVNEQIKVQAQPSELQKYILVWTKKYKTRQEIPKFVSYELIERSRSEARIKLSNRLMLLTFLTSIVMIISGKRAAERGDSLHKQNMEFHRKYTEEYEKKHGTAASTSN